MEYHFKGLLKSLKAEWDYGGYFDTMIRGRIS